MYGTCETLAGSWQQSIRETAADAGFWSPEEIQALADGMEISLTVMKSGPSWRAGGHPGRPAD
ncbi:hypothetical protein ECP030230813_5182 [Escherichia coli P0302308.13]|uniref:DUF1380 family protein n=1 Tax=Escherichia coli TaxID=562 RepID=UPI0002CC79E0|nr:hypothetical protein ECP030230813_5182 [Escherichia coli P0302308.13]